MRGKFHFCTGETAKLQLANTLSVQDTKRCQSDEESDFRRNCRRTHLSNAYENWGCKEE